MLGYWLEFSWPVLYHDIRSVINSEVFPTHTMKAQRGIRGIATLILSLDTRWCGQFRTLLALSPEKHPGTHGVGVFVGPGANLYVIREEKLLISVGKRTKIVQPGHYTD
jgi:hypothetical protein